MKALQFLSYGGPEVLAVGVADDPHAGPGEVRIRVAAASVNPVDWKIRAGFMAGGQPLEGVGRLGADAAGVVDEVGEGVTDVAVGDDVFGLGSGAQAELAVLTAWAPKPASVDWSRAAAAGLATETAVRAMGLVGVGAGSTVFVDGGAGGVGTVAIQVAVARGATVVASGGAGNQDHLRSLGAVPVVYGDGVAERVAAAAPGGVDAVLDLVGRTPLDVLVGLVDRPSQVVTIANFDVGDAGVQLTTGGEGDPRAALAEAAPLLADNRLRIPVQTFPLDRAAEAHRASEGGHVRGKLVLLP